MASGQAETSKLEKEILKAANLPAAATLDEAAQIAVKLAS